MPGRFFARRKSTTAPAPQRLEETRLVVRARRGDLDAYDALVQRYQNGVLTFCLQMTADAELAMRLSVEYFVLAYELLAESDAKAEFGVWLYRLVYEQLQSVLATLQHSHRELNQIDEVTRYLSQLPVDVRAVVVWADLLQLPSEEIAAILKLTLGTVETRRHSGRMQLRRIFEEAGILRTGSAA